MSQSYNLKMANIIEAFDKVSDEGVKATYYGEPWVPDMVNSHVQGMAFWKNYCILTHNNSLGSVGYLFVIDITTGQLLYRMDTNVQGFNHPSGIQVIGDFLVVAVEKTDPDSSRVCFYDLAQMNATNEPVPLALQIHRDTKKAGAVGI